MDKGEEEFASQKNIHKVGARVGYLSILSTVREIFVSWPLKLRNPQYKEWSPLVLSSG